MNGLLLELLSSPNLKMSLASRLRCNVPVLIRHKPSFRPVFALKSININGTCRCLTQPAKNEEEVLEMFDQRRLPTDYDPANFDPTEFRSPPTARVFRLVDEVVGLTLTEARELGTIIMKKKGFKEIPKTALVFHGAGGAAVESAATEAEEVVPEKSVFDLKLESFEAASKLKIVKEIRGFTSLGLKEAKELVEKAPSVLKSGVPRQEAEQIMETMKSLGAKVVME